MTTFLLMCWEFFKTGLFAIGGGLATIPFLQEMSIKYGWFTLQDLTTMVAVSESTPGPIGINMATYIGTHLFGPIGGLCATLSLVAPSIIVIFIVSSILQRFKDSKVIKGVFQGLRPAVVGIIIAVVLDIILKTLFQIDLFKNTNRIMDLFAWKSIVLFLVLFVFYQYKPKTHPIILVMVAALVGILMKF